MPHVAAHPGNVRNFALAHYDLFPNDRLLLHTNLILGERDTDLLRLANVCGSRRGVRRYTNALQNQLFTGHRNLNRLTLRNHVLADSYLATVDAFFMYPQHFTEELYSIASRSLRIGRTPVCVLGIRDLATWWQQRSHPPSYLGGPVVGILNTPASL